MKPPDLRLRNPSPGMLTLPWDQPLAEWDATFVPLRDIPVGTSRHLVKFVETDGVLWALKELPQRIAAKEYAVLRELELRGLPAVKAAGLVIQPQPDTAILITRYLEGSWQYRRLFMRLPPDQPAQRQRLLDAMVSLIVDLHRSGVFWGDCSLGNTLFSRDGQVLQAWLVDAETSEIHPELSDGQRTHDLDILVENVAGGMIDLAVRLERPPEIFEALVDEANAIADRYNELWSVLHAEPVFSYADRYQVESQIRRLHDLGFAVDEVTLQPTGTGEETLRLKVLVADRRYHATQLHALTGLDVGEGQAQILLSDFRAYQAKSEQELKVPVSDARAAEKWLNEVVRPGMRRAHEALGGKGNPIQAYCDLLEVRWLLSEQAGRDIGDEEALAALRDRAVPVTSAAKLAIAEESTGMIATMTPELMEKMRNQSGKPTPTDEGAPRPLP